MKHWLSIAETIFLFLLIWFVASHSQLLPELSRPYSNSIAYRLQTNAFLEGHVLLSPNPSGGMQDFVWTEHGLSQNWGMGVPLLRLPFECAAKCCGAGSFPDKWIILFYLTLMLLFLNASLKSLLKSFGISVLSLQGVWMRWYLLSWFIFCPAIIALIRADLIVYEEAIFYGYIYCCFLLSLFLLYLHKPSDQKFIILCLVSGFACLIRPTLIIYGLSSVFLASLYTYQDSRNLRLILLGIPCFILGIAIDLYFNFLRFGSIFEFGYAASISGIPLLDYGLRFFDYPIRHVSFLAAAKELIGTIFLNNLWDAPIKRYREHPFQTFNLFYLLSLCAGTFLLNYLLCLNMLKKRSASNRIISLLLGWGLISFAILFIFYLRFSAISSRYLCDFAPALTIIVIAIFLWIVSWLNSRYSWKRNKSLALIFLIVAVALFYTSNAFSIFTHPFNARKYFNQAEVNKHVHTFNRETLVKPQLPNAFYCGHAYPSPLLLHQFSGWDIAYDCKVSSATNIYLPAKKCLTINYSFDNRDQPSLIKTKRNLLFLKRTNPPMIKPTASHPFHQEATQEFCLDSPPSNSIAVYTIGWSSPEKIVWGKIPVQLNWIRVSDQRTAKSK